MSSRAYHAKWKAYIHKVLFEAYDGGKYPKLTDEDYISARKIVESLKNNDSNYLTDSSVESFSENDDDDMSQESFEYKTPGKTDRQRGGVIFIFYRSETSACTIRMLLYRYGY